MIDHYQFRHPMDTDLRLSCLPRYNWFDTYQVYSLLFEKKNIDNIVYDLPINYITLE